MNSRALATANTSAALLKINQMNLLLPQADIRTLESAADIDQSERSAQSVGWITIRQQRWPVYCLSDQLDLMPQAPSTRRACAMITGTSGLIGLMCDDVQVLKDFANSPFELPLAMRLPVTPVTHLVRIEQGLACVSTAGKLSVYIETLSRLG